MLIELGFILSVFCFLLNLGSGEWDWQKFLTAYCPVLDIQSSWWVLALFVSTHDRSVWHVYVWEGWSRNNYKENKIFLPVLQTTTVVTTLYMYDWMKMKHTCDEFFGTFIRKYTLHCIEISNLHFKMECSYITKKHDKFKQPVWECPSPFLIHEN